MTESQSRAIHRKSRPWRFWFFLVLAAGLVLGTRASLATHYRVPSGSMRPTICEGDRLLVDKRVKRRFKPKGVPVRWAI